MPVVQDETRSELSFSERIKAASWTAHRHAEESPFVHSLLSGELSREEYARLVAQHYFVYDALEAGALVMAEDAVAGPFVHPALARVPSLEADLAYLLGDDWRVQIKPTDATTAYCNRLREIVTTWPGGFVAHHYVRYMGDLSGGQVIRRVVQRAYELEDNQGAAFYVFDGIEDRAEFKAHYRSLLDAAPWSNDEQERIIAEVLAGYEYNSTMMESLAS
jgi:heme oxygenase